MTQVNRIIYNTIPQEWAFDPAIGPFIRDLLDIIQQLKVRTGGNSDTGSSDWEILSAVTAQKIPSPPFIPAIHHKTDVSPLEHRIAALEAQLGRYGALIQRIEDLEKQCLSQ